MSHYSLEPLAAPPAGEVVINLRAQRRQQDLIDHAAALLGKNRTDFMLEAACREAEDVLLDRRVFVLDEEAWQRFNALLDEPPGDLARLRKLLTTPAPWET
jgi:uncharacterized protein (DUF1778 family)